MSRKVLLSVPQFVEFIAKSSFLFFQIGDVLLIHGFFLFQLLAHVCELCHFYSLLIAVVFESLALILQFITDLLYIIMLSFNLIVFDLVLFKVFNVCLQVRINFAACCLQGVRFCDYCFCFLFTLSLKVINSAECLVYFCFGVLDNFALGLFILSEEFLFAQGTLHNLIRTRSMQMYK